MDFFLFSVERTNLVGNVRLPAESFNSTLENFTSDAFKTLKTRIIEDLKNAFCSGISICDLDIIGFRKGSVIVDFLIAIATGTDPCVVISQMNNLPAMIGGITVSPGIFATGNLTLWFLNDKEWFCYYLLSLNAGFIVVVVTVVSIY